MRREWVAVLALTSVLGCGGRPQSVVTAPRPGEVNGLVPGMTVGRYRLTVAEQIEGSDGDSIYRFSDGTRSAISAFRYDIPPDVRVGDVPDEWTLREGAKFQAVQPALVTRGRIDSYRVAFDTSQSVAVEVDSILEHSVAIAVRVRGAVRVDFQYLYIVCGRFLKLRGSFYDDDWQRSEFPVFAREVMRAAHAASARAPGGVSCN